MATYSLLVVCHFMNDIVHYEVCRLSLGYLLRKKTTFFFKKKNYHCVYSLQSCRELWFADVVVCR